MIRLGIRFALMATLLAGFSCGSPKSTAGLACVSTSDCVSGLICATEDPNGQCVKPCTPGVDSSCNDPIQVCSFDGHCYPKCKATADCERAAEGYVCKDDKPPRGILFCDAP